MKPGPAVEGEFQFDETDVGFPRPIVKCTGSHYIEGDGALSLVSAGW